METETMCPDEGIGGSSELVSVQSTECIIQNFSENSLQIKQDTSGLSKSIEVKAQANSINNENKNGSGANDAGDDVEEDDLEDGEIETDDDDESEPIITAIIPAPENPIQDVKSNLLKANSCSSPVPSKSSLSSTLKASVAASAAAPIVVEQHSPTIKAGKKRKYQRMDHDDFAGDIENAIAAALKKDGIEPPKSKRPTLDSYALDKTESVIEEGGRRGRIRKKREDREKNKLKRLKRLLETEVNDIDEDEMVCVRGGSPPPMPKDYLPPMDYRPSPPPRHIELYDSDDSAPSSYDSYDSADNRKMSYDERRQSRRKRDRRNRAGTNQTSGSTGRGGGGGNKRRNRQESDGDDCPRSHDARAPRKLELCKFYLMDCCAKKEKCSYMHADFPCKYYYLGMECVYKTECKFSHGDPLTETLKNILLKHIETAPKEILGSFRRISRETATNMLLTTHAKLCAEKGVENTLEQPASSQSSFLSNSQSFRRESRSPSLNRSGSVGRGSGGGGGGTSNNPFANSAPASQTTPATNDEDDWDKEDWDKPAAATNSNTSVANNSSTFNSSKLAEKLRKSRWCDTLSLQTGGSQSTASEILSLRNLKGVITPEQIERLEEIGIENLEQISQLTVAQLNSVGLTIGQIHEIQLNALNIQKLGLITHNTPSTSVIMSPVNQSSNASTITAAPQSQTLFSDDGSAMSQDVDMRVLVGAVQASGTTSSSQKLTTSQMSESSITSAVSTAPSSQTLHDIGIGSPEPTPNSGKLGTMDFSVSQYLKDSNLKDADKTDFNDLLKEDKEDDDALNEDEPELLIDESRCAGSDDEVNYEKDMKNSTRSHQNPFTQNDLSKRSGYDSSPLQSPKESVKPTPIIYTSKGEDDDNWDDDCGTSSSAPVTQSSNFADSQISTTSEYRSGDDDFYTTSANKRDNNNDSWDQGGTSGGEFSGRDRWQPKGQKNNDSRGYKGPGNNRRQRNNKKDSWQSGEDTWQSKSSPSDFYGSTSSGDPRNDAYGSTSSGSHRDDFHSNRNQSRTDHQSYDNKDLWIDGGASSASSNQYRDPRLMGNSSSGGSSSFFGTNDVRSHAKPHSSKSANSNYDGDWDTEDEVSKRPGRKDPMAMTVTQQDVIPPIVKEPSPPPKYQRASIYDGTAFGDDDGSDRCADDEDREFSSDRDMRVPSFLDSGDIDLRLPFKPVMTNYTPATEIDGSISSHPPIAYKVSEVAIPKPDYSEIRRTMTVTDKTLDPRLRRIFCLKEPVNDQYASDSEMIKSPPHTASLLLGSQKLSLDPVEKVGGMSMSGSLGGPRMDPRRRKENLESMLIKPMMSTGSTGLGQNVDIRMLLQKSVWYKNLNSKFKIMVNQQLALVSTELKKFHQDANPDKVFDMKFIATNQYLQQVLTNLGIFIDGNGQILQLDGENDDTMSGPTGPPPMVMPGSAPMMDPISPMSMNMDFMRRPQSAGMMPMNPRFMGHANMMGSFGSGFVGDIRPAGMLRVPPQLNPFANMQGNQFHGADCGPGPNRPNNYGGNDQYNPPNDKNPFKQQGGRNDWGGGGGRRGKKPPRGGGGVGGGGGGDDDYDSNRGFNDRHYGPPSHQKSNDGMMNNKKDDHQSGPTDFYSSNNKSNDSGGGGFYSKSAASVTPPAATNDEEECWD